MVQVVICQADHALSQKFEIIFLAIFSEERFHNSNIQLSHKNQINIDVKVQILLRLNVSIIDHLSERLFKSVANFEARLANCYEKLIAVLYYLLLDLANNSLFVERVRVENEV